MCPRQTKPKPAKTTDPQTDPAPDQDTGELDPFLPEMIEEYQENINDRFRNLTAAAEDEDVVVRVQLRRTEPTGTMKCPRTGLNIKVDGPLEWLPGWLQDYESYITDRYGGGTFLAQRRENGQIVTNDYFVIASRLPKIYDPEHSAAVSGVSQPPATPPAAPQSAEAGASRLANIGGLDVDLDQDDRDLMRQVVKWSQIQKIVNPPPPPPAQDLNPIIFEALLKLMDRPQQNPLEAVTTLTGLIETVRPLLSEGGSSAAGWADVINNAVSQVGKIVEKTGRLPVARPGLPAPEVRRLPAPTNGEQPENAEHPQIQEELMRNDPRQLAAQAIANINASFRRTKPIPADQMVEALDFALNLDRETRATICKYKQALLNMAMLEMDGFFEDDAERETAYEKYFEQVFDEFVRPDREQKTF